MRIAVATVLLGTGCVQLDAFIHNPTPCERVSTETCDGATDEWARVCTPCEDAYSWDAVYNWMSGTLRDGESIRPIDPAIVQDVDVEGVGGAVLDAYFIPAHGEHAENASVTLLYNHGNYAGIEHYIPRVQMAHEAGFNVFVWDYRGYGKSEPATVPTAEEWFDDARRVRDAVDQVAPDPAKVLLYANSLGGIPAIEMVLYRPGCALITEAGFTSMEALTASNAALTVPDSFLTSGQYNNIEKIKGYSGPYLAMIGDLDETFRVSDVEAMVTNAGAPASDKALWVLADVAHGISSRGIPEASYADWAERVDTFLDDVGACRD